ncbi:hypothetical protein NE237_029796 [Protea cynaroides]|uniref:Uncharacterized protein n=1 Tax=Protea cynaroides TaxID=273540 RepID=A0A9Q0GSV0_9MAGN|nr:hypothetical protein NE237_029796 [Protea cynaroides]
MYCCYAVIMVNKDLYQNVMQNPAPTFTEEATRVQLNGVTVARNTSAFHQKSIFFNDLCSIVHILIANPALHPETIHHTLKLKEIAIDYCPDASTHQNLMKLLSSLMIGVALAEDPRHAFSSAPLVLKPSALKATPVASTSTSIYPLLKETNHRMRSILRSWAKTKPSFKQTFTLQGRVTKRRFTN